MRRIALAALLAAALMGSAAAASSKTSGLHGVVTRGPVTPVCVQGKSCDEPAVGVTLVFKRDGEVVRRVKTNAHGKYRVRLVAGRYSVMLANAGVRQLEPTVVRVRPGRFARRDFSIDTGIR